MTGKTCQDVKNGYKWHWRRGQAACNKCLLQERTRQRALAETKRVYKSIDHLFKITVGRYVDDPTQPILTRWNDRNYQGQFLRLHWSKMTKFEKQQEIHVYPQLLARHWDKTNKQWVYVDKPVAEHFLKMKDILTELFDDL